MIEAEGNWVGEVRSRRMDGTSYPELLSISAIRNPEGEVQHYVAVINNMPLGPRGRWEGGPLRRLAYVLECVGDATTNWLHGSIAQRMRALHGMSSDPSHTHRFDRRMARLYVTLIVALVLSGAIAWAIDAPL